MRVPLILGVVLLTVTAAAGAGLDSRWTNAARELDMPVLAPTKTFGMTLKRVRPQHINCGEATEQLDASYGAGEARKLTIYEGKPFYCGDLGDAPVIARLRIHGKKATLYEYCQGTGCRRATFKYALYWREQGIQVGLISRGTSRSRLVQLAQSMALVNP